MKMVKLKESPPISLAIGTEKTISDKVRITHTVSIAEGWSAATEIHATLEGAWGEIGGNIRKEIERSTNKSYAVETERERSVTIKGTEGAKPKVVWVEYRRVGKAKIQIDGREFEVPFEFREDFDLLTE